MMEGHPCSPSCYLESSYMAAIAREATVGSEMEAVTRGLQSKKSGDWDLGDQGAIIYLKVIDETEIEIDFPKSLLHFLSF